MKAIASDKISEGHLARRAFVYIRQSSERQVRNHVESGRVQYSLPERAGELGWREVELIDEDLGKSAAYDSERSGFQRLVAQVGMGDVGIVISLEATRLARNNRDWYQLIELCTIFDTLIGDHQSVYDPKDPNDRRCNRRRSQWQRVVGGPASLSAMRSEDARALLGEMGCELPLCLSG